MIDPEVFAAMLDELATLYKREFSPFVQSAWYEYLSDRLTTDELIEAVKIAVVESQFLPLPKTLVSLIKGDNDTRANQEWQAILQAATRSDATISGKLSEQGRFALRSLGGINTIAFAKESELNWKRKDFVELWKSSEPKGTQNLLPEGNRD